MNRIAFILCMLAPAWVLAAAGAARAEVVDQIAATIDTEVILLSDLYREAAPALRNLQNAAASQADFDARANELLERTLEQAIEAKILLREAQLIGMEVLPDRIEEYIAQVKKDFGSEKEFLDYLEANGETLSEARTRLTKQLLSVSMSNHKRQQIAAEFTISEEQISQYYNDNRAKFERPERIYLRQILLRPEAGGEARAKARLESLRDEVRAGGNFSELAKAHSEGPGAEEGGIIGWTQRGDLIPELEEAAFALDAGAVSDVVESPVGLHLLYAERREAAGTAGLDETRMEIEKILRDEEVDRRYKRWMADLRQRSRLRIFI